MHRHLLAILLILCLLFSALPVSAEESAAYTATAETQLRMRVSPSTNAKANGQIPKGETVYIIEYDFEWAKVIRRSNIGYVLVRYLSDITPIDGASSDDSASSSASKGSKGATIPEQADLPLATTTADNQEINTAIHDSFTMTESTFEAKFKASALKAYDVFAEPDEDSKVVAHLSIYTEVDVGEVVGDWCYIHGNNAYGYILTSHLFKWDRYDPYAGPIPNLDVWTNLIWIKSYVRVRELGTDKILEAVNADSGDVLMPGSAFAAWDKDEEGRYIFPIERTYGYVYEDDVAWVMPVKDWSTAESGDLISVMTTFFSVGIHTLEYRGRNWNIRLACSLINGTVLQPGDTYNQNEVIGPYNKAKGYKIAPTTTKAGYGGGTCQVNSTFYVATVQLPLLVIQRQVHQNVGMHYIKIGLDASVGSGNNTLRMQNTLPFAIRYQFFVSDGVLTCAIFKE